MNFFSDEELFVLIKGDVEELQKFDRKIADSLSALATNENENIFNLCVLLGHRRIENILICQDVACLLIEKYLDPEIYLDEALQVFRLLTSISTVQSPVWFYLARGKFSLSDEYFNSMERFFSLDPAFFSEVAAASFDKRILPHISSTLKQIAPFIKYLPLTSDSHEYIVEHEYWRRMSKSYLAIFNFERDAHSTIDEQYLESELLSPLPFNELHWRSGIGSVLLKKFITRKSLYLKIRSF